LYGGYNGLRIGSNACCGYLDGGCPSDNLIEYEIELDWLVKRRCVIAFCAYHLANHTTGNIIKLSTSHGSILVEENGRWRVFENSRWGQIHHLYKNGATYTEVGHKLGISRERVRQLLAPTGRKAKPSAKKNIPAAQILSASQVSRLLNIHINTVRRWSENGTLPAFRIGNRGDRRFYLKDIERFIRNGNIQPAGDGLKREVSK
jgi:excisionase family DNA binding protein